MVNKGHGQHSQRPAQGPDDSIVALATKHCCGTMRTVHRLDRDAAGLMVLAKTKEAATALSAAFADHTARRTYRAAIGVPLPIGTSGTVDAPLKWAGGRCWVDPSGVAAVTHYSVVERRDGLTWLEVELETGRMHQIRVHMKHALSPLVGDRKYGGPRAGFLHLHAVKLTIPHPKTGEMTTFSVSG